MKLFCRMAVFTMLLVISFISNAAGSQNFTPTLVGCFTDGKCFFNVTPSITVSSCPVVSQIRFMISDVGGQAIYSAVLAAIGTNKIITVSLTDTCLDNTPTPLYLYINK